MKKWKLLRLDIYSTIPVCISLIITNRKVSCDLRAFSQLNLYSCYGIATFGKKLTTLTFIFGINFQGLRRVFKDEFIFCLSGTSCLEIVTTS